MKTNLGLQSAFTSLQSKLNSIRYKIKAISSPFLVLVVVFSECKREVETIYRDIVEEMHSNGMGSLLLFTLSINPSLVPTLPTYSVLFLFSHRVTLV